MKVSIIADLISRGFVYDASVDRLEYASGSICNFANCTVYLDRTMCGECDTEIYYQVKFYSFRESGSVLDHETTEVRYVAEIQLPDFMRSKGMQTDAEREAERALMLHRIRNRNR